jgi:hypothetical protein
MFNSKDEGVCYASEPHGQTKFPIGRFDARAGLIRLVAAPAS